MYSYAELDWAGDPGTRRVGRTEAEAEERMARRIMTHVELVRCGLGLRCSPL